MLTCSVFLIIYDPLSKRVVKNEKISQRYADFILFIGSIPAALFFVFNKILMENRMVKHLILYYTITTIISCILAVLIEDATFSRNEKTGLFGFCHWKNSFINIVIYGGLNTIGGSLGWIASMHFFSPIIVMNAVLLECFVGQIAGYYVGLDHFPSY